jgi:hypothetical protein
MSSRLWLVNRFRMRSKFPTINCSATVSMATLYRSRVERLYTATAIMFELTKHCRNVPQLLYVPLTTDAVEFLVQNAIIRVVGILRNC